MVKSLSSEWQITSGLGGPVANWEYLAKNQSCRLTQASKGLASVNRLGAVPLALWDRTFPKINRLTEISTPPPDVTAVSLYLTHHRRKPKKDSKG